MVLLTLVPVTAVTAPGQRNISYDNSDLFLSYRDEVIDSPLLDTWADNYIVALNDQSNSVESTSMPSGGEIRAYIYKVFGEDAENAMKIVNCESGFNVQATNPRDAKITGYTSWGLWMHNEPKFEGWDDYKVSTDKAYEKFQERGFYPWFNCSKITGLI